jgi:hypothetical protein
MKKTALTLTLILTLLFSVEALGMQVSNTAIANPLQHEPITVPPSIFLQSPTNTTYLTKNVPLEFSVNGSWSPCYEPYCYIQLSLDGGNPNFLYSPAYPVPQLNKNFSITLESLSEGSHYLQITATIDGLFLRGSSITTLDVKDVKAYSSIYFNVDTAHQSEISILSPVDRTYNITEIPLTFTINKTLSRRGMVYSLDGQANVTVGGNITLTRLSEGAHRLTVYALYFDINTVSSNVYFTVDTTAPSISVLSLENKVYNASDIPLVFTVNESVSQITYSIDGKENITINGNSTLTGLLNGDHNLIVYAADEAGNRGVSETIYFSVKVPFPTTFIIIVAVSVAVAGAGLLVYLVKFKKQQKKQLPSEQHKG